MIPYQLLLLLGDDPLGLALEGAEASPVTLVGHWGKVIESHAGQGRIVTKSGQGRIETTSGQGRIEVEG